MELGEFEFDLSEVDVAAFESVGSEVIAVQEQQQPQLQQQADQIQQTTPLDQQQQQQQQQQEQQQEQLQHQLLLQQQQHQQLQQQHLQQQDTHELQPLQQVPTTHDIATTIETATPIETITPLETLTPTTSATTIVGVATNSVGNRPSGKIVLVPIKHLLQLPGGQLTASGKQVIQLQAISTSNNEVITASQEQQHHIQALSQQQNQQQQHQSHQQQLHQQHHLHLPQIVPQVQQQQLLQQQNEVPKRKPCNCTKSQCLKLYCDCFANGEFCSGCNCTNCFNSLDKEKERQKAISQCLDRNPEAFRPKIGKAVKKSVGKPAPDSIERRHTKGCNCKRSGCLKNYCECYEAKILCSQMCKCCGCKNYEESFERKSLVQLTNSASENARGILRNLLPTNSSHNTGKDFTKCFITDKVINASLVCLLQSAQQAEKDELNHDSVTEIIHQEMGKCLRMIVDSASE